MNLDLKLSFDGGYLNPLKATDVYQGYVDGLNNHEVNQYLEIKFNKQTFTSVVNFVDSNIESESQLLFGIWTDNSSLHCGTLRLHGIEHIHHTAHIGICIFDKNSWGQGLGRKAIQTATTWAISELGLRWIEAGAYKENIASQKTFISAGYGWVCDISGKYLFEGKPTTVKIYAAKENNFNKSNQL